MSREVLDAKIAALRRAGWSLGQIADWLHSQHHAAPRGGMWHPQTIKDAVERAEGTYTPRSTRRHRLMSKFGITVGEYERLHRSQDGGCAICGAKTANRNDDRALAVDHDHVTGQVRGLLCTGCNRGLGYFRDDPDLLRRAASYLLRARRHQERR